MLATAAAWAPGRVNLMGEHLDYNGGRCLPVALPCGTTVRVARRDDDVVRVTSTAQRTSWQGPVSDRVSGGASARANGWAAYAVGVLWALAESGLSVPPLDIEIGGDVPLGAGLSSSASLEAAVAVAVCALLGLDLDPQLRHSLVDACVRAEQDYVGAPTGGLDQRAVLLAEPDHALLLDFADGSSPTVPFAPASDGVSLLVIDTRVTHAHLEGGYALRRAQCEAAASLLGVDLLAQVDRADAEGLRDDELRRRARHVVTEQARVRAVTETAATHDWEAVGQIFLASHASLRDDFEVSCPEVDLAVVTSAETGALGARMTGGGFGGSVIALVPSDRVGAVQRAMATAYARAGLVAPVFLDGTASGGARVLA